MEWDVVHDQTAVLGKGLKAASSNNTALILANFSIMEIFRLQP
jgi:hypothetical protein